ncbi:MAG: energy-coupling factor transporter transmembrane protein EcfT [Desulfuromonadales bacterium]|nr:energy-coupling factor transporter transmembrane protein EcfT [Desulfuromonadales bacterium]
MAHPLKPYRRSDYGCQFLVADSPVHRLGAGLKLLIGTLLCAAAVIAQEPWSLGLVLGLNILYYFGARLSIFDLWRDTRYLLFQMLFIMGMYLFRYGYPAGVWPGLRIALQIALFFIPGIVFLRTTQASQMMRGLNRILPYRLSFLVFTSFRFVPLFAREIREITMAQRLRGARLAPRDLINPANWGDIFHCLMIPLIVRALKTADEAALSAEARGFGIRPQRTYYDTLLKRNIPDATGQNDGSVSQPVAAQVKGVATATHASAIHSKE